MRANVAIIVAPVGFVGHRLMKEHEVKEEKAEDTEDRSNTRNCTWYGGRTKLESEMRVAGSAVASWLHSSQSGGRFG